MLKPVVPGDCGEEHEHDEQDERVVQAGDER